jgi:hypothetical protein
MFNFSNHNSTVLFNQGQILIEIEKLVKSILATYQPIRLMTHGQPQNAYFNGMFYMDILNQLPRLLTVYSPVHQYSEHIEALWAGCMSIGLIAQSQWFSGMALYHGTLDISHAITLVQSVVAYAKTPSFTRKLSDRLNQAKERNKNLRYYAASLHAKYPKLMVISICFSYLKEHRVGINDVCDQWEDMLYRIQAERKNTFKHAVGYAWGIEQGSENGGYHIHAVFYFNGNKRQYDQRMAKRIGDLWESLTACHGYYRSSNDDKTKARFARNGTLGVGMILRSDPVACANATNMLCYLAKIDKDDQYLRMKPKGRRTFGKGHFPD